MSTRSNGLFLRSTGGLFAFSMLFACGNAPNSQSGDPNTQAHGGSGGSTSSGGTNANAAGTDDGSAGTSVGASTNGGSSSGANGGTSAAGTSAAGTTNGGSGGTGPIAGCGATGNVGGGSSELEPGVLTQLSTADIGTVAIDPTDPDVIYVAHHNDGIWRSTDAGSTWTELGGSGPDPDVSDDLVEWLDDASVLVVDPADHTHLYATNGVDGASNGFFVSTNWGESWTDPVGFPPEGTSDDVTMMDVDPCDFGHILVSSHSDWTLTEGYSSGIMESTDGGETWVAHLPPNDAWSAGTKGVAFLFDPKTGTGDSSTWLVLDESNGFWRTSDAGDSWEKVSDAGGVHGWGDVYYASNGTVYSTGGTSPKRSTDNGLTWADVTGAPFGSYPAIGGDGTHLWAMPDGYPPGGGYHTSLETEGATWEPYSDTTKPERGPSQLRYQPLNGVLYGSHHTAGLWALKVAE